MSNYKRPIQRSLLTGCAMFIFFLCALLSIQSYLLFSSALYRRYNDRLKNILAYVEKNTDAADLAVCIKSGVTSPAYDQLQALLNGMIDDFELISLYIAIPRDDGIMVNVVSATSITEAEAGDTNTPFLYETDAYPRNELARYLAAWDRPEISYFQETSVYGTYYTACKPLKTPEGMTIALACGNLSIDDLYHSVNVYVLINVLLTIASGVLFAFALLVWLRRNVTGPVLALEKSTRRFAERSHDTRDPDQLSFEVPEIRTLNEVQSLAEAISQMSADMRTYIQDFLLAEGRIRVVEEKVAGMTRIAYQDALTSVKNKRAYNAKVTELAADIAHGQAEFAIIMVDLNNLKRVNDTYGHEKGDQYIIGACRIVSHVFKHSPVFRIGGDEFVVILEREDYHNRVELYAEMEGQFQKALEDESRMPWERYSAAVGMAAYNAAAPESVEYVVGCADEMMYRNKRRMKAGRA